MPVRSHPIQIEVVSSIARLRAPDWDQLVDPQDPFLEHSFLSALEVSKSIGVSAGCVPRFVLARDGGRLVGAVPLYLKTHSYGEYIFDWAWADAAQRVGIRYYPKLVAAVPYTPVTGMRVLVAPDADATRVCSELLRAVRELADDEGASSVHFLFCSESDLQVLAADPHARYLPRLSMQFHWHNRPGRAFESFDDYLSVFRARNRKQVRRERAIVAGHGLSFRTVSGVELSDSDWAALCQFYTSNVARHQGFAYLQPAFFEIARGTLAHRVLATLAYRGARPIAGTLNFERGSRLYGRYWGFTEEFEMLHFELCYYRLIERAIERRHTRFEAGAQGAHKLKRGLLPRFTHSSHWIRDPRLAAAVASFIELETRAVRDRVTEDAAHAPFREGTDR